MGRFRWALRAPAAALVIGLLAVCDGSTDPDPLDAITSITVTPPSADVDIGSSTQFTAVVRDGRGEAVSRDVTWTSSSPSVATVSSTGLATGAGEGVVSIRASIQTVSGSSSLTVIGPPSRLEVVSGDGQLGYEGETLGEDLVVLVTDGRGEPVSQADVVFSVTEGDGTIQSSGSTDPDGLVSAAWTLGESWANEARAVLDGDTTSVTFSAIGFATEYVPGTLYVHPDPDDPIFATMALEGGEVLDLMAASREGECVQIARAERYSPDQPDQADFLGFDEAGLLATIGLRDGTRGTFTHLEGTTFHFEIHLPDGQYGSVIMELPGPMVRTCEGGGSGTANRTARPGPTSSASRSVTVAVNTSVQDLDGLPMPNQNVVGYLKAWSDIEQRPIPRFRFTIPTFNGSVSTDDHWAHYEVSHTIEGVETVEQVKDYVNEEDIKRWCELSVAAGEWALCKGVDLAISAACEAAGIPSVEVVIGDVALCLER
ncbi:Ig-like domain-containing protein, partial [Gemmatimonadota bacterium]